MSQQQPATAEDLQAQIKASEDRVASLARARSASRPGPGVVNPNLDNGSQGKALQAIPEKGSAHSRSNSGAGRGAPSQATTGGGSAPGTPTLPVSTSPKEANKPRDTGSTDGESSDEEESDDEAPGDTPATTQKGKEQASTPSFPKGATGAQRALERTNRELLGSLNEQETALIKELQEINGQDSYDALAAGIGRLRRDEYLVLPVGFSTKRIPAFAVGHPSAHQHLTLGDWANVYVLNKDSAPTGVDAPTFALLRMEAVKAGWYDGQREVRFALPPDDALRVLASDLTNLRDKAQLTKEAAFLVPLVAEHVFRTMGHHYITTDAATYTSRYADTFRSCLIPEIATLLPAPILYHAALHWVSPARSREVLTAQLATPHIPDAIRIRYNAAPAGTALLTTTEAILKAMSVVGLVRLFQQYGDMDLDVIVAQTLTVKEDPCKYHKSHFAYNVAAPSRDETIALDIAKTEAERFAPYAQAFINTFMRDAALGRARALKKHADGNPIQLARAANLFRRIARAPVDSVEDLFRANIGSVANADTN